MSFQNISLFKTHWVSFLIVEFSFLYIYSGYEFFSICKYFLEVCVFFYFLSSIFCSTRDLNFDSPVYHCFFLLWFVLLVLYLKTLCQTPGPGVSFCYSLRAYARTAFEEAEGNCDRKMVSSRGYRYLRFFEVESSFRRIGLFTMRRRNDFSSSFCCSVID